jgi:carbon monoxide dehydrogenase subunit G
MPAATYSHSVTTTATVAEAWTALQNPDTWSNISLVSSVSEPEYADDGTLVRFAWIADIGGKSYPGVAESTSYTYQETYGLTMDTSEMAGDVIAKIEPEGAGCTVTVEITFRTKGMLSAMFFPAIRQALSTGFPQQIEDLVATI